MQSENILEKIKVFEKLAEEFQTSNQSKNEIKNNLYQSFTKILAFCTNIKEITNWSMSIYTLDLLWMLVNKYNCDQIFESEIDCKLLIIYAKAFVHQSSFSSDKIDANEKSENFKKLSECLSKKEKILSTFLNLKDENFFIVDSDLIPFKKKMFGKKSFKYLNYCLIYVENLLQHTALLSHLKRHEEALQKSEICFKICKILFSAVSKILDMMVIVGPENFKTFSFSDKKSFQNLIKYVEYIVNFKLPDLNDKINWEPDMTNWKHNKNNLEKFLIKKISYNSNFDFLVDKIDFDWTKNFHISSIVKLKKLNDFMYNLQTVDFSENFIIKCILVFSCCIFSMAAENRSISNFLINQEKKIETNLFGSNKEYINKYHQETNLIKEENFKFSKIIHSKALEVLLFGFPQNIKLFLHFRESYKNHYIFDIGIIPEEEEISLHSQKSEYYDDTPQDESKVIIEKMKKQIFSKLTFNDFNKKTFRKKNTNLTFNTGSRKLSLNELNTSLNNTLATIIKPDKSIFFEKNAKNKKKVNKDKFVHLLLSQRELNFKKKNIPSQKNVSIEDIVKIPKKQ
jgi:hypothetical protein